MGKRRKRKPIQRQAEPPQTLEELQAATYRAARTWHRGLGMELFGVNIGRCLEYSVLHTVNSIIKEHIDDEQKRRQEQQQRIASEWRASCERQTADGTPERGAHDAAAGGPAGTAL